MKRKRTDNFISQRDILNFRPHINFVEPNQIEEEKPVREVPVTLNSIKSDTTDLVNNYQMISDLSDAAQAKIDTRASNLVINLDPQADAHIIAALQRHFSDPNKTSITYADYRECLDHINSQSNYSTVDPAEINKASQDTFRTDFGTFATDSNRADLQPELQSVQPIDLNNFQLEQLEKLLELLTPGISTIANKIVIDAVSKII